MSEVDALKRKVTAIHGEIAGILSQLPLAKDSSITPAAIAAQYNDAVDELDYLPTTDYSRYKLTNSDGPGGSIASVGGDYLTVNVRTRIGSLVKRLEEEYDIGQPLVADQTSPLVVTVNQNQQLSLTVTPIQYIVESVQDEQLRDELRELKNILETTRDQKKVSGILNTIQQRSWELFIKVLPYVLEHLGNKPHSS